MVVLLFDIDGTLILTGGAGGDALLDAFSDLFGVAKPQEVPFSGRTDRGIVGNLFHAHDIPDTEANWHQLRRAYLQRLTAYLPQRAGRVLPGIETLLNQLSARTDLAVGLLTGNARDGARLKLEHFGLYQHFAFGAYGDDHVDRDDVARAALVACQTHLRAEPVPDQVWIIGDTPLDIRCARAVGARVVAVATGWDSRDALAAAEPDLLLDTLEEPDALLARIS